VLQVRQITPFVLIPELEPEIDVSQALGLARTFRGTGPGGPLSFFGQRIA
jgi:hypothetical protein